MKSEGLSPSRLAELLETQPSRISHIVSGRNKASFDLLQKILRRFPRINPDWLLLDSPTMYRDDLGGGEVGELNNSDSSPIDLFGLESVSRATNSQNREVTNGGNSSGFQPGFLNENGVKNYPQNMGENSTQNSTQNYHQNHPQNGSQNAPQNGQKSAPQNAQFSSGKSPSVERIIVLYSDGTFTTYNPTF